HSSLGLSLFPLLLLIAITGLTWSEWAVDNILVARQWLNWQTPTLATSLQTDNLPTVMHHEHHEMPHSENLNLNMVSTEYDTALSIARAHGIDAAQIQIKPPTSGN
ncbi:PepSY domain-containing protein, partial [Acinetobacter geminorum]